MKTKIIPVLLLSLLGIASAVAADSPISVSIAVPASSGERRIDVRDSSSHFHVILTNTSDKPQRIWKEWCSWGYYGLTFKFNDATGRTWVAKKKQKIWTRNAPDWLTLEPRESLVIDVYPGDSEAWEGFPIPEDGSKTVTMQAVFGFEPEAESRKQSIWTGRTESEAGKFTFYHWKVKPE